MYFDPDQIAHMNDRLDELTGKYGELAEKMIQRNYVSSLADEHAKQGFCRRLRLMTRSIQNVFRLLPPELEYVPDNEAIIDTTINIQSFLISVVGCCDNLAWIWVGERAITQKDGSKLQAQMVSLRSKVLIETYPDTLSTYIKECQKWLDYVKDFRDSLGHRIPLYIPPYIVDPKNVPTFQSLGATAVEALKRGEVEEFKRLEAEQEKLKFFRPWFTHSFREESGVVVFHSQMLIDFATIHELGQMFLQKLEQ